MPTISTNTAVSVPAGALLMIKAGGAGRAIDANGIIYTLGLNEVQIGPFTKAQTVAIQVNAGPITYAVEADGTPVDPVVRDPYSRQLVTPDGQVVGGGGVSLDSFGLSTLGFSAAFRAAVAYCVEYAAANNDRCPAIILPDGDFTHDGLTINMPPWVPLVVNSTTRIACEGQVSTTNPFIWIRADLPGYTLRNIDDNGVGDYSDGGANVGFLLSGPGRLQLKDTTNTGTLIRIGSGDGVMGALYTGGATIYTTKFCIGPLHIRGGQQSVQFTNYQTFSVVFLQGQINGAREPIWTSTSTQGFDFGEQHVFDSTFISNTIGNAVTLNSAHQFLFIKRSITFTQGTIFQINADRARVHTIGVRLERFTKISDTSGNFPNSCVTHSGRTHIIPTRRRSASLAYDHYLRVFWDAASGQTYKVCPDEIIIDMGTAGTAFNQFTAHPSNLYLASPHVDLQPGRCIVDQSTPAAMKASPVWNTRANLFPNGQFTAANINGWHRNSGGAISYQGSDGYAANGCLEVTVSAAQCIANSPRIGGIRAGAQYAVDFLAKVLASGSPTANFAVQCVVHWFRRGVPRTLGNNPLSCTNGSNVITVNGDADHGLRVGDMVWISGATDSQGILAVNINGWRRVSAINSTVSWSFEAGSLATATVSNPTPGTNSAFVPVGTSGATGNVATATGTGGGAAVVVEPPVTYISTTSTQSKTIDNATSVAATGTGSISGTTLTITNVQFAIVPGAVVTGTGVTGGTTIVAQLSGTPGADGTYQVSASQTVASTAITCTSTGLKDLWMRHGGSLVITAPAEAIAAAVQVQTGSNHTGTVRFDDFVFAELS